MHVFIRAEGLCMEIPNITLIDGCIPSVGDDNSGIPLKELPKIEPAVWFKALVFDSVSIDCVKRAVMWNCDSALYAMQHAVSQMDVSSDGVMDSKERRRRITESMYIGGECYGYEMDELFTTMQVITRDFEEGRIGLDSFNDELLRLLHCYVLPAIPITADDIPLVTAAFTAQEQSIRNIDAQLLAKDKKVEELDQARVRQLMKFVENLVAQNSTTNQSLPPQFASVLYSDIEKEISLSTVLLERHQEVVEEAKKRAAQGCVDDADIHQKRTMRDQCFERHKQLLTGREVLRLMMERQSPERKKSLTESITSSFRSKLRAIDPLHNIYLEMHRKREEIRKESQALIEKKVLMISVKEAIRNTLSELQGGKDQSLGIDSNKVTTDHATDVLVPTHISREWLTLAERMAHIFDDPDHRVTQKHSKFCAAVNDVCLAALFEKQIFELTTGTSPRLSEGVSQQTGEEDFSQHSNVECGSPGSMKVTMIEQSDALYPDTDERKLSEPIVLSLVNDGGSPHNSVTSSDSSHWLVNSQSESEKDVDLGRESLIQLEGQIGDEDVIIIHDTDKNHLKSAIERLKHDIKEHFNEMTETLQKELGYTTTQAYKKIWLRYESHFYRLTFSNLIELYNAAYSQICDRLRYSFSDLTAADLDLQGSVITAMLEDSESPGTSYSSCSIADEVFRERSQSRGGIAIPQEGAPQSCESCEHGDTPDEFYRHDDAEANQNCLGMISDNHLDSGICCSRVPRHFSEPASVNATVDEVDGGGSIGTGQVIKRIQIHYPSSITVLYNRRTWPLPTLPTLPDEVEYGVDAVETTDETDGFADDLKAPRRSTSTFQNKILCLQQRFRDRFQHALDSMKFAINEKIPLLKLQHLTTCLREINKEVTQFQAEELNQPAGACSDDLIDMLVVLLCNAKVSDTVGLYPHLMLLTDLIPPFFEGGHYSFSLVQFWGAFQFIQDRMLMKKRVVT